MLGVWVDLLIFGRGRPCRATEEFRKGRRAVEDVGGSGTLTVDEALGRLEARSIKVQAKRWSVGDFGGAAWPVTCSISSWPANFPIS